MGYEDSMNPLLDMYEQDKENYLKLCKKYHEKPQYIGKGKNIGLDLVGMHFQELKLRERREKRIGETKFPEIEVKLPVDKKTINRLVEKLGEADWCLQENIVYQTPQGIIRFRKERGGKRFWGYQTSITIKGKNSRGKYNQRSEIERPIDDSLFEEVLCGAEKDGAIVYSKKRASYDSGNCKIYLDDLARKYFVEIEGDKKDIAKNISKLGLEGIETEKRSYDEIVGGER